MEEDRLRSAHSIDLAYKQFLNNNVQGGLMGEDWYNQVSQFSVHTFEKTNGFMLEINETYITYSSYVLLRRQINLLYC